MKATPLEIEDVLLLEPNVFNDERGFFFESFNQGEFNRLIGRSVNFVQDNHSRSIKNVIRGLHYQIEQPQGKLIRVLQGEIFDVAVDIRKSSPTFGKSVGVNLSAENKNQIWIPEGFAHGFSVVSEYAEVVYKVTDYWLPSGEQSIFWNDPSIGINWPITGMPLVSAKDSVASALLDAEVF